MNQHSDSHCSDSIESTPYLERLKLALEATSDALWDWHIPSGKAYFSERYYTMLGYEPNELPPGYETWKMLLHPEDKKETIRRIQQHIQSGSDTYGEEFRLRMKTGKWLWVLGRGKVIERDVRGIPIRMVGTHIDIDRRKRAEHELALYRDRLEQLVAQRTEELEKANVRLRVEIEERQQAQLEREQALVQLKQTSSLLEAVFDSIPDVIGIQDQDHRITRYNAAGYRLLKKPPSEVIGRRCYELIGRQRECDRCATSETYRNKAPSRVERFEKALGAWLDVRAYPIFGENGNIVKVIEHLRDISYEKNAEKERLKLLEKLKHAQKMEAIGTLAGGIAHDFNNLLMGVLGNVSLLLQDIDPHEPEYDKIKNIEEFAKSGAELTNQLLGLARGGRYEVRPTDVKELIRSAAEMFGRTKKEIQVLE
jgi:PAS domain S-box-containing protein